MEKTFYQLSVQLVPWRIFLPMLYSGRVYIKQSHHVSVSLITLVPTLRFTCRKIMICSIVRHVVLSARFTIAHCASIT
jgi:hypothetical protein